MKKDSNTRTVIRFFNPAQFEEEAAFLSGMHRAGWALKSVKFFCIYSFEACEGEEVNYHLDYDASGSAITERYVRRIEGRGWEYLFKAPVWSYFRKNSGDAEADGSVFCTPEARVRILRKTVKKWFSPIVALGTFACLPHMLSGSFGKLTFLFVFLLALYALVFVPFYRKYLEVKEKYGIYD